MSEDIRAEFIDDDTDRLSVKSNKTLRSALKKSTCENDTATSKSGIDSSPLLNSTPPTVSKALVKLYPYLIIIDSALSIFTWTNEDVWKSILMVSCFVSTVLYFETLIKYFGHLLLVGILWGYSSLDQFVEETIKDHSTLDDIIQKMACVTAKFDLLLSPITVLTNNDIKRLLFTMIFLSPIYAICAVFIFPPKKLVLISGVYLLTYHSSWSRVTRKLLWRFKLCRLLAFYVTGLDLSGVNKYQGGIFAAVQKKVKKLSSKNGNYDGEEGKPIRFIYVLYENQRRWLGIGWTSNMLSYERNSWTDEFLNEGPPPEQFKLPEESGGMVWRWVDKTWRLDMTNDGAIQLSSSRPKTTSSPSADDGFIYYDNTWKKPSIEDSFSKYTRRRRWIRTAELIKTESFGVSTSCDYDIQETVEKTTKNTSEHQASSSDKNSSYTKRKVMFNDAEDVHIFTLNENENIDESVDLNTGDIIKTNDMTSITKDSSEQLTVDDPLNYDKNV